MHPMQPMRIDHIAIWTTRLEELKRFYETYFNAKSNDKYTNEAKRFESYFLSFHDGARLELMRRPDIAASLNDAEKQASGYIHMAISAGSTKMVDELTSRLEEDGFTPLDGPRWTGDGCYESCVPDPDGNRIEITASSDEAEL